MNRDEAREKLVDLVYGELDAAGQRAVMEQVNASPELAAELQRLQGARKAMGSLLGTRGTGFQPVQPQLEKLRHETARPARWHVIRWLAPLAAAAAAVVLVVTYWQQGPTLPVALADKGPIEIQRTDLSLTILSTPENAYSFAGLALVRDQRLARHLPKGESNVTFTGVPSGILPDSVRLRSLDAPEAMTILEQNYQYDLATTEAILAKYVDKPVKVTFKDGSSVEGDLLSFEGMAMAANDLNALRAGDYSALQQDRSGEVMSRLAQAAMSGGGVAGTLVIRPKGEGPRNISRKDIQNIAFPTLPEGLLSRPSLLWKLHNTWPEQKQSFEVAYMTHGIDWRADYVLKLRPGPADGQQTDTADIVGYATITNNSGISYENAQLKLMAGDVHLVQEGEQLSDLASKREEDKKALQASDRGGFAEKAFFEYHLYTLGQPTTIRNAETKQIEMLSAQGVKMKRLYVYDRDENPTAARVVSELKNDKASGLGQPLPKGVIRLWAPAGDADEFASQTNIDHTAQDEKIRLTWGYAFDVACSSQQTENKVSGLEGSVKWHYTVNNQKPYDVTVVVVVRVPATADTAQCDRPWTVKQVGLVEIPVLAAAGQRVAVDFGYHYNNRTGGGLKSPHVEGGSTQPATATAK